MASTATTTHAGMRTLDKSVKMCRDEGELLGNLVYRGRNQYRAFGWWQKVVGVYRQQKALVRMLNSRESSGKEEGEKKASNVPNGAQIHKCLAQYQAAIDKAYFAVRQIIQLESFMAFALTLAGILARLKAVSEVLLIRIPKKLAASSTVKKSRNTPSNNDERPASASGTSTPKPSDTKEHTPVSLPIGTDSALAGVPTPPNVDSAKMTKPKKTEKDDIDDIFGDL